MQNNTNGEVISRVKSKLKVITADNRLVTNRLIYSLLSKQRSLFAQRQDAKNKILRIPYIYQTLPLQELEEVDKVVAGCGAIRSGCTIKRLKEPLPTLVNGFTGPIIRDVSSLDSSISLTPTTRQGFVKKANSSNYKYNTETYYWYEEGVLYFPELEWDAVVVEGFFEEDIRKYSCKGCGNAPNVCLSRLEEEFFFPAHLLAAIESEVDKELRGMLSIPTDESVNKNNTN